MCPPDEDATGADAQDSGAPSTNAASDVGSTADSASESSMSASTPPVEEMSSRLAEASAATSAVSASADLGAAATEPEPELEPIPAGLRGLPVRLMRNRPDRRQALWMVGGAVAGSVTGFTAKALTTHTPEPEAVEEVEDRDDKEELGSREAKKLLVAGNERYVAGEPIYPQQSLERRKKLVKSQKPFAIVLACADSRVPPELLFDQGLGDLFVVRSAGEVLDKSVIGSLQYGVEHLHSPLLVVLGHTGCGAVGAAVEFARGEIEATGTQMDHLIASILPAIKDASDAGTPEENLHEVVVSINVEHVVAALKADSLISEFARRREVKVTGALYDMKTGEVDWL